VPPKPVRLSDDHDKARPIRCLPLTVSSRT
jgi:hypothetical protein